MGFVRFLLGAVLAAATADPPAFAQTEEPAFRVYTDHPRLFLQTRRLRLLEREKERQSIRWREFQALMAGKAAPSEPGFAAALYARVSGEPASCREAVRWALTPGADLRQTALVFDWCQPELSGEESERLATALERGIANSRRQPGVAAVRDRTLAAIALAGHRPDAPERELRSIVQDWWGGEIVPALEARGDPIAPGDIPALMEILHAVKDNLDTDLRDPVRPWFHDLPTARLFGYLPAPVRTAENDFYIPVEDDDAEPDLRGAALARAADLALVAFDANTQPAGFLQGWLMRDTLLMRGALGAPYEFLWANPYQPGLSFHHAPPFYQDTRLGRLYVRSTWDDGATWLEVRDGKFRQSAGGRPREAAAPHRETLVRIGGVGLYSLSGAATVRAPGAELSQVFLIGLRPGAVYEIRLGSGKPSTHTADAGGVIGFALDERDDVQIRVREWNQ